MLTIIVACGQHGQIGYLNQMPWHNKEDLAHFKQTTLNQKVIMGRKTLESLPKILPNREIFVVSRNTTNFPTIHDFENFCQEQQYSKTNYFVCGGAEIYKIALPYAKQIILSYLPYDGIADTFFPIFDMNQYDVIKQPKETFMLYILNRKENINELN